MKKHGVELPIGQVREHRESRLSCRQSFEQAPQIRVLRAVGVAVRVLVGAAKKGSDPVVGVGGVQRECGDCAVAELGPGRARETQGCLAAYGQEFDQFADL